MRVILASILLAVFGLAQTPPPLPDRAVTGVLDLRFRERSPHSALSEMCKRFSWTSESIAEHDEKKGVYELKDEPFKAYVPKGYNGKTAYSLLVWISPIDAAWTDPTWVPIADDLKLIMVTSERSGNERYVWYRMGLALDAAHGMQKQFKIDPKRIYIAGFSGGGRVASSLGIHYPDIFAGGYYMGGTNWYAPVTWKTPEGEQTFAAQFPKPTPERLRLAINERRHVWMVGETDFNHDQSQAVYNHAKSTEKFQHTLFQEAPGLAHAPPPAKLFEQGLRFLMAPEKDPNPKPPKR